MRIAVVGHVEWVTFAPIDRALEPGVIAHAPHTWDEAAGGGGMAAAEMARLCGGATLFTALGTDEAGRAARRQLEGLGVEVVSADVRAQRRALTLLDPQGERTIVVVGPAAGPTPETVPDLARLATFDAVYFCKGDAGALRAARGARVLVATARVLPVLQAAGVRLDALVHSERDAGERYLDGDLDPPPALICTTRGADGGRFRTTVGIEGRATGHWSAAPLPATSGDAYGAGDAFAAALTFALARGLDPEAACAFAARSGAAALGRRGAHGVFAPS